MGEVATTLVSIPFCSLTGVPVANLDLMPCIADCNSSRSVEVCGASLSTPRFYFTRLTFTSPRKLRSWSLNSPQKHENILLLQPFVLNIFLCCEGTIASK